MNHKYAAKLNLDLKLFKSDLHPVEFLKNLIPEDANDYTKNIHYQLPHKLVSDELKEFFIKHGKLFGFIEIFYIPPNSNLGLHTDEHVPGSYGKINWVFSGKDSQMIWYDLKDPSVNGKSQNTYINTPSISYKIEDLIFKYAEHLEGPNLVEVAKNLNIEANIAFSKERIEFEKMNVIHNISDFCINISYIIY